MWFDYENDKILVNTASHRPKCEWIRKSPRMTSLLVNPGNPYHWVQIKHTVEKELREWEPDASTASPRSGGLSAESGGVGSGANFKRLALLLTRQRF